MQTLLDGITVRGKKLEEAGQILALSEGMDLMISAVRDGTFPPNKEMSDRIHGAVAKHEAIRIRQLPRRRERTAAGRLTNLLAGLGTLADARVRAGVLCLGDAQPVLLTGTSARRAS